MRAKRAGERRMVREETEQLDKERLPSEEPAGRLAEQLQKKQEPGWEVFADGSNAGTAKRETGGAPASPPALDPSDALEVNW